MTFCISAPEKFFGDSTKTGNNLQDVNKDGHNEANDNGKQNKMPLEDGGKFQQHHHKDKQINKNWEKI